jgi:hypothetical protein
MEGHDGHLGGVVVSVLAIESTVRGFKPNRADGFLRAIIAYSTLFFGGELKPETHVVRFYGM